MQGIPQSFEVETDQAQFRLLAHRPAIELYRAHIEKHAFEPHAHDAFGIGTVLYGAERFRHRGTEYVAAPGSLVLMNPDELHTGKAETEQGWHYLMIYLAPDMMSQISGQSDLWFQDVLQYDPLRAQSVAIHLQQIWQSVDALEADCLLQSLVSLLQPLAKSNQSGLSMTPHRLAIVCQYLQDNLNQKISLSELAALVHLSPFHFLRQFQQQYHVTPQQMLMAYRLSRAKALLAQGIPSAQVATETGLTDQSHLVRAFSRRYGTTPARYQRSVCR